MLYNKQVGNPEGKPLVLLHGWGMHSGVWQSLVELLENDFSITLIDLPGLGHSVNQLPQPYTLETVAEQVLEVAPEQAFWLGWSLGGVIATAVSVAQPERVTGLITLGSSPCFVERDGWPYGMAEAVYSQFESSLAEQPGKTLQRFNMLQTQGSATARNDLKLLKALLSEVKPTTQGLVDSLALLRGDYRSLFARVAVPQLSVLCQLDMMAPASLEQPLVEARPDLQVEVIEGYSHIGFLSDPLPLAEIVRNFAL